MTGLVATASAAPSSAATSPGAAAPATAPTTAPVAVPEQVLASLGRLVSRGDGTHRLTIKLQPEALGEVRVVLTVRDGDVSVRLSGSDAAQRALLQGAHDLQRLLENVGARTASVLVGDPTGGQAGSLGQFGQSGQPGQAGAGWGQQPSGSGQGRPGSPSYARPDAPATADPTPTRSRTGRSGLDVTV